MNKRTFFACIVFALCASFASYAQMSDEAIVQYITRGLASGKTKTQIGNELMSKGVTASQAKRLVQSFKDGSQMGEAGGEEMMSLSSGTNSLDKRKMAKDPDEFRRNSFDDSEMTPPEFKLKGDLNERDLMNGRKNITERKDSGNKDKDLDSEEMVKKFDEEEENTEDVRIFGHDIFRNRFLTFEPNENAATPDNYVIGPGDQLIIEVWGESEVVMKNSVTPEGFVNITQVGQVSVAGMTIEQAKTKLRYALSKRFSLSGRNPASNLSVTLGKMRTVKINILGEVNLPGTYRLSPLSTVLTALYRADGVTDIGSLRNISVLRGGKVATTVDVYKLMFEGGDGGNVSLMDGDAIVVPPYTALMKAEGGVKRPMYYEIIPDERLENILGYAGGFVSNANPDEVLVQRKDGTDGRVFTVKKSDFGNFAMKDGDLLSVYQNKRNDVFANRVEIKGSVLRPGVYEFGKEIATVRQLVEHAGGLLEDAFRMRAQLIREKADRTLEMKAVAIGAIVDGTAGDVMLRRNDILIVSKVSDVDRKGDLSITGYVLEPGYYEYAEGMTVEDLILRAGGLENGASTVRVDVSRRIVDPTSTESADTLARIFSFSISDSLRTGGQSSFTLQPYDVVSVRRSPTYIEQRRVRISGEATFPGEYTLVTNKECLSDLVARAGGITGNGYVGGAMLKRKVTEDERNVRRNMINLIQRGGEKRDSSLIRKLKINDVYTIGIDLPQALANPHSEADFILHDGDELIIPSSTSTVRIQGEVMYPNSVNFLPGKNVKYYINQAGGFSNEAKRSKVYVVYMNGKVAVGTGAKILPGSEVVVPSRPERQKISVGEWLGIGTTAASITTMIATIANLVK